jgi:hypothetical protein
MGAIDGGLAAAVLSAGFQAFVTAPSQSTAHRLIE